MNSKRVPVVYKVSGESLSSWHGGTFMPICPERFAFVADELTLLREENYAPCVVVGGGNIFRGGSRAAGFEVDPNLSHRAGMTATAVNANLLAGVLVTRGIPAAVMSRGDLGGVMWDTERACELLAQGTVVILAGGMGRPGMSTDYPAVFHAAEIGATAVLVAKHGVDAVFTADPHTSRDATRLEKVTCTEAIEAGLGFMDLCALEAARDDMITLFVFSSESRGAGLSAVARGEAGTVVLPL